MVATCVLAAGCSSAGDQAVVLPSVSAAPSPTASVPPVPLAARARTVQGADAFMHFYFERLNEAFATSNSALIRAYSHPLCGTCANYAKGLDAAKSENHFLSGDSFGEVVLAAAPLEEQGTFVEVAGTLPSRRVINSAGKTVEVIPAAGRFRFRVAALWTDAGWLARAIKIYP